MTLDDLELHRLGVMAHALRPDWPASSVTTWLRDHPLPGRSYRDIALALTWCAQDPSTGTPARLAYDGPWWARAEAVTVAEPADPDTRCSICGQTPARCRRNPNGGHEYVAEVVDRARRRGAPSWLTPTW